MTKLISPSTDPLLESTPYGGRSKKARPILDGTCRRSDPRRAEACERMPAQEGAMRAREPGNGSCMSMNSIRTVLRVVIAVILCSIPSRHNTSRAESAILVLVLHIAWIACCWGHFNTSAPMPMVGVHRTSLFETKQTLALSGNG